MPVKIPDPSIHKICIRCHRWFEPAEGTLIAKDRGGLVGGALAAAASISGVEPEKRFICSSCVRFRRRVQIILAIALIGAIGAALLTAWVQGRL